jgi:hypothetical protein
MPDEVLNCGWRSANRVVALRHTFSCQRRLASCVVIVTVPCLCFAAGLRRAE